jgi:hypothetical protein
MEENCCSRLLVKAADLQKTQAPGTSMFPGFFLPRKTTRKDAKNRESAGRGVSGNREKTRRRFFGF